ncbi:SH3 domain-containing protein [Streptomyces chryseus]|uniref:SH3 domain-containing protein n=1 Tax=Streptomyces chryseus TaxID=68186 RepID=UPI00142EE382|nr:SH3 domain-containing protein [Streptomyces chryseus]GGX36734.1 hypothetical protein GCM10010353_59880 [Streptomyces chryseus]
MITTVAVAAALVLPVAGAPAVAAPSAALAPAPSAMVAYPFNQCGYYPKWAVNLRQGPSTRHRVLGVLHPSDKVYAKGEKRGWLRVKIVDTRSKGGLKYGTTGWVKRSGLRAPQCMNLN